MVVVVVVKQYKCGGGIGLNNLNNLNNFVIVVLVVKRLKCDCRVVVGGKTIKM